MTKIENLNPAPTIMPPSDHRVRRAPRILQTGTYSSWNKGDAAMQLGAAAALRSRHPGAVITISAPFPAKDLPFYGEIAHVVPSQRRRPPSAALQITQASLWRLARLLTGRSMHWFVREAELQATLSADLVMDLSGDMLTDDYGPHVACSHYVPIILALLLDRPVFVCAQSIGPFRFTGWLARSILRRVDTITVRDEISLKHLETLGLDPDSVEVTADMACLLEPSAPERVAAILAAEGIQFHQRPILGVSLSRILERRYTAANRQGDAFTRVIAEVLDFCREEHGLEVLFVPHVTGPGGDKDDRRISEEVAAAMRNRAHVIRGDYRPEELKALIGSCALILGARMHANIAALSSGTPVVALSYSHKTPGIMALFGQSQRVIDGAAISTTVLKRHITDTLNDRDAIAATIRHAAHDLRDRALRNLDIAEAAIRKSMTA